MATVYHVLLPEEASYELTSFAQYVNNTAGSLPVTGIAYDSTDDTNEQAFWKFRAINYVSLNSITVDIEWYADTASTGDVKWDVQIAAITPNVDTQDVETLTFDDTSTVTDSHLTGTAQRLHRATITIAYPNLGSVNPDDIVWLLLRRDTTAAGADTLSGDVFVIMVTLSYSDA